MENSWPRYDSRWVGRVAAFGLAVVVYGAGCKKDETTTTSTTTTTETTTTTTTTTGAGGDTGTGGQGQGGSVVGGGGAGGESSCVDDGTCSLPDEDCACPDCSAAVECGVGCTEFTVDGFSPPSFSAYEVESSMLDGPLPDFFQVLFLSATAVGTYDLAEIASADLCVTTSHCPMEVTENFNGKRYRHHSGQLVVTSTSPPTGYFQNLVLYNTTQNGNAITYDPSDCVHVKKIPFPGAM